MHFDLFEPTLTAVGFKNIPGWEKGRGGSQGWSKGWEQDKNEFGNEHLEFLLQKSSPCCFCLLFTTLLRREKLILVKEIMQRWFFFSMVKKVKPSRIYGWVWKCTAGLGENLSKILVWSDRVCFPGENGNIGRHYLVVRKPQGCQFLEFGKSEGQILQPVKENIGTRWIKITSKIIPK